LRVVVPKAVAPSVVSAALDVIGRSDDGGHVSLNPAGSSSRSPPLLSRSAGGRDSTAWCPTRPARARPTPTAGSELTSSTSWPINSPV